MTRGPCWGCDAPIYCHAPPAPCLVIRGVLEAGSRHQDVSCQDDMCPGLCLLRWPLFLSSDAAFVAGNLAVMPVACRLPLLLFPSR
jgi:hypothetical protein